MQERGIDVPDNQDRNPTTATAFQVRGRFLTALALRIDTENVDDVFYGQLDEQVRKTPHFFNGAPIVLDLSNTPALGGGEQMRRLVEKLRARELHVFGVQNGKSVDAASAAELGLIVLPAGRDAPLPRAPDAPAPVVENKIIRSPVRSGQLVMAEHGDLTIIGSVASGAELVAAGNIHVYGTLRGRAMAGCHGNTDAHIFCQSLDAELVAIAGLYQTNETLDDSCRQRVTHIYLSDEKLCMEAIA